MEIKQLRIGNLLDRNGIMEVLGIGANNKLIIYDHYNKERLPYGLDVDSFKGIELTPEWLTRAGFENLNVSGFVISGATYWRRKGITIYEIEGKYMLPIGENLGDTPGRTVIQFDKLHELQNIFALTGEELAIDKTSLKN